MPACGRSETHAGSVNAIRRESDPELPLASAGFAALDLRCPIGFSRHLYID
jgi:hypothetical protein